MITEEQRQLISDFKTTFNGQLDASVRVLNDLSKFCLEDRQTYIEESARKSDFNEGARSVILYIRRKLNYNFNEQKQTETEKEKEILE